MFRNIFSLDNNITYVRYIVASAGALLIDFGIFLLLIHSGVNALAAASLGYSAGILTHWLLSSRHVFNDRVEPSGLQRRRQKLLFVASALIGLAVTSAIVGAADKAKIDLRLAKIVAVAISFQLTYLLRNRFVFAA
jgi:putative flippase GtrA